VAQWMQGLIAGWPMWSNILTFIAIVVVLAGAIWDAPKKD